MIRDHGETASVSRLYRKHFEKPADKAQSNGHHSPAHSERSDEEIIEKARAEKGGKFDRLWRGDTSDYDHDHSDADDGFVHKLYSYTQDEEQIRRIHTASGLHRPEKSGKRHKYLGYSLERARNNTTWFYEWAGARLTFGAGVGVNLSGADANGHASEIPGESGHAEKPGELSEAEIGRLLSEVQPERVSWLWPGRIPLGKLSLIDGDPGTGKSGLTGDIAARVSAGFDLPDGYSCEPGGVVLLSAEDGLADTIRPRLDAAGADTSKVLALATTQDREGHERMLSIPEDLSLIERGIRRVGASLVIVDPLMAFLSGEANAHKDQDTRKALAPLSALAERTGAAVVVVRHLNKATGTNALYRGGGSIGIIGAARSALLVAKDPEDENRRVLAPMKSNLAMPAPSLAFTLEEAANGAVRVAWRGSSELDASMLLATSGAIEEGVAYTEATEFLREMLSDGPVYSQRVWDEAGELNVSEATLKRAKKSLGVQAVRENEAGESRGAGRWMWEIPRLGVRPQEDQDVQGDQTVSLDPLERERGDKQPEKPVGMGNLQGDQTSTASRGSKGDDPLEQRPRPLTEEQVREVRKLISSGMEPALARQEVLGIAEI